MLSESPEKANIVNKFIQEGKISKEIIIWLTKELLSSQYGWTPKEIDEQDIDDLNSYIAILRGKHGTKDGTMGGTKGINRKIQR